MDWNAVLENASSFWTEIVPSVSTLCTGDRKLSDLDKSDIQLDPSLLSQEPRSLSSSEFTEQNSLNVSDSSKWTAADDSKLIELIRNHNYDWKMISKSFNNHSIEGIKTRWEFLTKKNLKSFIWKKEDDDKIIKLYSTYNGCWNKICELFPGRTKAALKNRYYGVLKKKCNGSKSARGSGSFAMLDTVKTADTLPEETKKPFRCLSPEVFSGNANEGVTFEQKREQITKLYSKMWLIKEKLQKAQEKIEKVKVSVKK